MVRTQIQLTAEQYKAVRALAAAGGVSSAEVIRQAINVWVKSCKLVDEENKHARALGVAGRFRSGKHDVSKNHDAYLNEAYGR